MKPTLTLITALLLAPLAALQAADPTGADRFVRAEGAGLTRAGIPFRAVGFNQPDLVSSFLLNADEGRAKSFAAIDDASRSGVRFLRFWASGFWPRDMKLYYADKAAYWARMDEIFRHAREKDVMLVPSIFWQHYLWPDLCDEPRGKIADPESKTYQAMRTYATELVTRYKDDPNVLMWELGNEYFLEADLNASDRPKADGAGSKELGTRPVRKVDDSLTTDMLLSFYANMTAHIHAIDPNHLVTSGDRGPRPTSRSLRENFPKQVWEEDSLDDHLANLRNSQPRPLDVMSIHCYGNMDGGYLPDEASTLGLKTVGGLSLRGMELMTEFARTANAAGMPLFVGELGQHPPYITEDPEARFACAAIDLLEKEGGDLIAIWAWHFPAHPKYTVTGSTYPALLKRVSEFNRQHAYGALSQRPATGQQRR
jgi:mannan endo-1,4-beta-mannosidase